MDFKQSDIPLISEAMFQIGLGGSFSKTMVKLADVLVVRLHPLALRIISAQYGQIHELRECAPSRADVQWECETWAHQNRKRPCMSRTCDGVAIGIMRFCVKCQEEKAQIDREAIA